MYNVFFQGFFENVEIKTKIGKRFVLQNQKLVWTQQMWSLIVLH